MTMDIELDPTDGSLPLDTQTQKLVYGVGINDLYGQIIQNGKHIKVYEVWHSMIRRCYSEKYQVKEPTYRGCSVCPDWLVLSNFKEWFDANYRDGLALDKDILIQGNKVYRPEACSFIPQYVNSLMTDAGAIRGNLPLGVSAQKPDPKIGRTNTTYKAQCSDGHGRKPCKTFKTVAEARQWYIATKKKVANEQAIHALEAGDITEEVYQALIIREW